MPAARGKSKSPEKSTAKPARKNKSPSPAKPVRKAKSPSPAKSPAKKSGSPRKPTTLGKKFPTGNPTGEGKRRGNDRYSANYDGSLDMPSELNGPNDKVGPVEEHAALGPNAIPAHAFAGPYDSVLLQNLPDSVRERYAHLNCSFFDEDGASRGLTVVHLKWHVQSLCNLIADLTAQYGPTVDGAGVDAAALEFVPGGAFDWLPGYRAGLYQPPEDQELWMCAPLLNVVNLLHGRSDVHNDGRPTTPGTGANAIPVLDSSCVLGPDATSNDLIQHADSILGRLHYRMDPQGGLLALLPEQGNPNRAKAEATIFGQWLIFTANLVRRVREMELEVANARDVLAGEAFVPYMLCKGRSLSFEGRPLLFPQDSYVLANLSRELWERLNEALVKELDRKERKEQKTAVKLKPGKSRVDERNVLQDAPDDPMEPIAWIDVPSRIYRICHSDTMFIVPGHGLHPSTFGTQELERQAMVVAVPVSTRAGDGEYANSFERQAHETINNYDQTLKRLTMQNSLQQKEIVDLRAAVQKLISELNLANKRTEAARADNMKRKHEVMDQEEEQTGRRVKRK